MTWLSHLLLPREDKLRPVKTHHDLRTNNGMILPFELQARVSYVVLSREALYYGRAAVLHCAMTAARSLLLAAIVRADRRYVLAAGRQFRDIPGYSYRDIR